MASSVRPTTSTIGLVALPGIEVRSSLLMVDFTENEPEQRKPLAQAVVNAGNIPLRRIRLTILVMMAGSFAPNF